MLSVFTGQPIQTGFVRYLLKFRSLLYQSMSKLNLHSLQGKVAIISGSTRGIGRECALTLARLGCNIVIAAKTVKPNPKLPGTIYSVAAEVRALGVDALA